MQGCGLTPLLFLLVSKGIYVLFSSVVPEYLHLRNGGTIRLLCLIWCLSWNLGPCMSLLCAQPLGYTQPCMWPFAMGSGFPFSTELTGSGGFWVVGAVGTTGSCSPGHTFWSCLCIESILYAIGLYITILKQHQLEENALPLFFRAYPWVRIGIVKSLRTVAEGLNPAPRFFHRTMEHSGSSGCKTLKEGCCISEVHYTSRCHGQPFGVSLWETGLQNLNEWSVRWSWHSQQRSTCLIDRLPMWSSWNLYLRRAIGRRAPGRFGR